MSVERTVVDGFVGVDTLAELFSQLAFETIRPQLEVMTEKHPQVVKMATNAYIIAKERLCFQNLLYIFHRKRLVELAASLRARGVSFYQSRGILPSLGVLPELDVNIPWKVLKLICRGEHLSEKGVLGITSPEFRELIFECFACQRRFPDYVREIDLFLDLLTYKELRDAAEENFAPVIYTYDYWVSIQQGTKEAGGAIKTFVGGMHTYLLRREQFGKELLQGAETRKERGDEAKTLAQKTVVIDSIFISFVEKSLAQYQEKGAQEARMKRYSGIFSRLQDCAKFLGVNLDTLVTRCIGPSDCALRGPKLGEESSVYPHQILHVLQQMDMTALPSIEDFSQPLREIKFPSFVESCREAFLKGNVRGVEQAAASSSGRSDFLPPHLLGSQKKKIGKDRRVQPKKVAKPVPAKSAKKSVALIPENSVHSDAQSTTPQGISPQGSQEEQHGGTESRSVPLTVVDQLIPEEDTVSAPDLTGPDPSLRYADHVARWFEKDRDIFHQDPSYKEKTYSRDLQDEIRFRHAFGLALVPVILKCGKQFMKVDSRTGQVRLSYTLPGEVIRRGGY